jgi:uncharacterized protein
MSPLVRPLLIGMISILIPITLLSQDVRSKPSGKQRLVYDYADFLSEREEKALNQNLENFALETSNQILFISEPTLNGLEPYEYANGILSTWGIGQKELNNGIVILVKPKTQDSRGQVFISVAYGLEGAIPDATAKQIVENEIIPQFKQGQNYEGIVRGVEVLKQLAKGEIDAGEYQKRSGDGESSFLPILFILLIFFFIFLSRVGRTRRYARNNNLAFWTAFWLLSNSGRSHGGSWNSFSGGSGFGGGGGGFGGFGGGFGGGGGAGGSW